LSGLIDGTGPGSFNTHAPQLRESAEPASCRVLVVDDEESVRSYVVHVLAAVGYEVTAASNGEEALDAFQDCAFHALVTDLRMPGISGDELARQLRQRERRLKVLYLTGFSDELFEQKAALWAGEAFLDKPFTSKGLREALSLLVFGGFQKSAETPRPTPTSALTETDPPTPRESRS
jgi:CheY-like chemotaxis protein